MSAPAWRGAVKGGCLVAFATPFAVVGAWLLHERIDTRQELRAIERHVAVPSIAGVSGPVRLVGTLHSTRSVHTAGGADAVWSRTTVRRLERGGGARVCDERGQGAALRVASGELVLLDALLDAQVVVGGVRPERNAALPTVRVHHGTLEEKALDDASSCTGPPSLAGRVAAVELSLPVGQVATVFACVRGGSVEPCGDGADAIVVGKDLGELRAHVGREPERIVISSVVHLVLLLVVGFASLLALPSRRPRFRVDVVQR
jgi:hypothetical protein